MKRNLLSIVGHCLALGLLTSSLVGCAPSAKAAFPETDAITAPTEPADAPGSLLPASDEVGDWKRAEVPRSFVGSQLFDYINGAGEVHMSYGFLSVATCLYQSADAGREILLDIYDMGARSEAFGIYTYFRHSAATIVSVGHEGFESQLSLEFWKGRYYVRAQAFEEFAGVQDSLRAISQAVAAKIRDELPQPSAPILSGRGPARGPTLEGWPPFPLSLLPSEGKLPRTDKFFHTRLILDNVRFLGEENVLGLNPQTNCATALYERAGSEVRILLAAYPDHDAAEQALERYAKQVQAASGKLAVRKPWSPDAAAHPGVPAGPALSCFDSPPAYVGCAATLDGLLAIAWGHMETASSLVGEVLSRVALSLAEPRAPEE